MLERVADLLAAGVAGPGYSGLWRWTASVHVVVATATRSVISDLCTGVWDKVLVRMPSRQVRVLEQAPLANPTLYTRPWITIPMASVAPIVNGAQFQAHQVHTRVLLDLNLAQYRSSQTPRCKTQ
jgi:hypothetical protein